MATEPDSTIRPRLPPIYPTGCGTNITRRISRVVLIIPNQAPIVGSPGWNRITRAAQNPGGFILLVPQPRAGRSPRSGRLIEEKTQTVSHTQGQTQPRTRDTYRAWSGFCRDSMCLRPIPSARDKGRCVATSSRNRSERRQRASSTFGLVACLKVRFVHGRTTKSWTKEIPNDVQS